MVIRGDKLFGRVYQVAGVCRVETVFFHFWFCPIWPMRTYIVLDDPGVAGEFPGARVTAYGFLGRRVRMSPRSVLAGYFRAALGVVTFYTVLAWWSDGRDRTGQDFLTEAAVIASCLLAFGVSRLLTVASPARAAALLAELLSEAPAPAAPKRPPPAILTGRFEVDERFAVYGLPARVVGVLLLSLAVFAVGDAVFWGLIRGDWDCPEWYALARVAHVFGGIAAAAVLCVVFRERRREG
jgi:hypothetical protein